MKLFITFIFVFGAFLLPTSSLFAADYGRILKNYSEIHKALASDKLDEARNQASKTLKALPNETKTSDGAEDQFVKRIGETAQALTRTTSDKDLRTAFGQLSEVVVDLIRNTDSLKAKWQLLFCPMVPKGTFGYWAQPTGESLLNPYYGAKMLTCGVKRPW